NHHADPGERAIVRRACGDDGRRVHPFAAARPAVRAGRTQRRAAGARALRNAGAGRGRPPGARAGGGRRVSGTGAGEERRERLAKARLYVVTGARGGDRRLIEFLEEILAAGVDAVQLREKEAEAGDLLRWGEAFREVTER